MVFDRRSYKRMLINKEAVLYVENKEISCLIRDISEKGVGLIIENQYLSLFSKGTQIDFSFVDFLPFGDEIETAIVRAEGFVRHMEQNGDTLTVGCYIPLSDAVAEYVKHKSVSRILSGREHLTSVQGRTV